MNKTLNSIIIIMLTVACFAVPASPDYIEHTQSDGTKITMRLYGDEFVHWGETLDGYSLLAGKNGDYQYARKDNEGNLVSTGIRASNLNERSLQEIESLATLERGARFSKAQVDSGLANRPNYHTRLGGLPTKGKINMLMLLVEFSDSPGKTAYTAFDDMVNKPGYAGTGSFKEYYYENSYGQLEINTDVFPQWVKLSKPRSYYSSTSYGVIDWKKMAEFARDAVLAADSVGVDFSKYDNDNNGTVDGIAIIHQGTGQEMSGNPADIWSHNFNISAYYTSPIVDGKRASAYTTQPEKYGSTIVNMGILCHEVGHNLGIIDFYDTDYDKSGGNFLGTGKWDVMAGGSYNNGGKTPAHHNPYTKLFYKWIDISNPSEVIQLNGKNELITLPNYENNKSIARINTKTANEYFLLVNMQKTGFDKYLPGHGLLVYHVDGNWINSKKSGCNQTSHQGLDIEEADGRYGEGSYSGDPFPGTSSKKEFNDSTTPSSKSWSGISTEIPISEITEDLDSKTISFKVQDPTVGSDPEFDMPKTTLAQNYPNPFNPQTQIEFNLSSDEKISLSVYNAKGEMVCELVNDLMKTGKHSVVFDGSNFNSGIYFYKLQTANNQICNKMVLLK